MLLPVAVLLLKAELPQTTPNPLMRGEGVDEVVTAPGGSANAVTTVTR